MRITFCFYYLLMFIFSTQVFKILFNVLDVLFLVLGKFYFQKQYLDSIYLKYRKRSVFIPIPNKGSAKECSNYCTIAFISHASKVMLKILQARLQQYHELPDVQAGFRKGRGTRNQIANTCWVIEKESSRKTSISALLTMPKSLTVWITINRGKFLKRWEYQATLPASSEICMQIKKKQLEPDIEQQTGSKLGKEYVKAVYCHPAYLNYMQCT